MPGSGSEGISQRGKTSALNDLSLLLARWEGPVCTLAPCTTVPAMPFPWLPLPLSSPVGGGVRGWEAMDFGFIM